MKQVATPARPNAAAGEFVLPTNLEPLRPYIEARHREFMATSRDPSAESAEFIEQAFATVARSVSEALEAGTLDRAEVLAFCAEEGKVRERERIRAIDELLDDWPQHGDLIQRAKYGPFDGEPPTHDEVCVQLVRVLQRTGRVAALTPYDDPYAARKQ